MFIADGHHRYETGLRYLEERRAAGEATDPDSPPNYILMMLVGMSDPGLVILPTHRLVSGLPGLTAAQLSTLLAPHFDVERVGEGDAGAREAWERIEMDGGQELLGFGTTVDGVWQTARLRSPTEMARLASNHSEAWRGLAVSVLQILLLDHVLAANGKPSCKCVSSPSACAK